jgi:hypothetical protein
MTDITEYFRNANSHEDTTFNIFYLAALQTSEAVSTLVSFNVILYMMYGNILQKVGYS